TSTEVRSIGSICSVCACKRRLSSTAAMPPRRSCLRARSSSTRFIGGLLGHAVDVVAVVGQLADQRIDLTESERRLGVALEVPPHEAVRGHAHLQRGGASVVHSDGAVFAQQRAHSEDAPDAKLALVAVAGGAEGATEIASTRATSPSTSRG